MPRVADVERAHALALNLQAQRRVRGALEQLDGERAGLYARQLRLLAELGRLSAERSAHAVLEVAGTLGVGQVRATTLLEHARRAVELFPRAVELLELGALRPATVELLLYVTAHTGDNVQAEVGRRVVDELIGCDAVDARALIVATVLEVEADLDLQAQEEKHAQARANRGVWVKPVEDGMARIGAEVDAVSAQRFQLDLDALCRVQKRADEQSAVERTAEQRRADVLAELPGRHLALLRAFQERKGAEDLVGTEPPDVLTALCALPVPRATTLYVHCGMTTLLDLDNRSGWVDGLGPISAHQARLLRPTAALQAIWADPDSGVPLGIDPKTHPPVGEPDWSDAAQVSVAAEEVRARLRSMLRPVVVDHRAEPGRFPSTTLARLVRIRDLRCTGVGSPMPASRCELDHLVPVAEGGLTAAWSLGLKSPRCHHARHEDWTATRNEADGSTTWDSPAGGQYTRRSPWRPPPPVRGQLPPARLDRPDGGKARTLHGDTEPASAGLEPEQAPVGSDVSRAGERRRTALDDLRERGVPDGAAAPSWGSGQGSDEPPPF